MKEITIGRHVARIYESAEDMPVVRWNKMQKMMMLSSGIGSDMDSVEKKVDRISRLLIAGSNEEAKTEVDNLKSALSLINAGVNPKSLAFAVLVHDIDGAECDDMSDDGLQKVLDRLEDLTQREVNTITYRVKKKFQAKCRRFFRRL